MSGFQFYESRVFCIIWHIIALGQYGYAIYYDNYYVTIPENMHILKKLAQTDLGGRTKFLTYWCLVSVLIIVNTKTKIY